MEKVQVARHPLAWSAATLRASLDHQAAMLGRVASEALDDAAPVPIGLSDVRAALAAGFDDFKALRTDVVFLCVLYPLVGLVLGKALLGDGLFHLAFPLASGFALLGPVFAAGLYEMSRQRERGLEVSWATAFDAFRSPAILSIVVLGLVLVGLFAAWVGAAELIYRLTLGATFAPGEHISIAAFTAALFSTARGTALMLLGVGVGFVFAAVTLAISVVSFPLLLDRNVSVRTAVRLSVLTARESPGAILAWGVVVAALLVAGSLPFLIGLAIVLPVLGHATWHLYRRVLPV